MHISAAHACGMRSATVAPDRCLRLGACMVGRPARASALAHTPVARPVSRPARAAWCLGAAVTAISRFEQRAPPSIHHSALPRRCTHQVHACVGGYPRACSTRLPNLTSCLRCGPLACHCRVWGEVFVPTDPCGSALAVRPRLPAVAGGVAQRQALRRNAVRPRGQAGLAP